MVAMLAFGGTYAYFTATAGEAMSGDFTTATVQLGNNTMFTFTDDKVVSGQKIVEDGTVTVTNKSNVATYIFIKFSADFENQVGNQVDSYAEMVADGDYYLAIDGVEGNGWTKHTTGVYYREAAAAKSGEETFDVCKSVVFFGKSASSASAAGTLMNQKFVVSIESASVQTIKENTDGTASETKLSVEEAYAIAFPTTGD